MTDGSLNLPVIWKSLVWTKSEIIPGQGQECFVTIVTNQVLTML